MKFLFHLLLSVVYIMCLWKLKANVEIILNSLSILFWRQVPQSNQSSVIWMFSQKFCFESPVSLPLDSGIIGRL